MPSYLLTIHKVIWAAVVLVAAVAAPAVHAAPHAHAHVHGNIQLGIALDGPTVTVNIDTPLESLIGFEHAPRSAAQKQIASRWSSLLTQGARLLRFNPEAGCTLQQVALEAPVLGLSTSNTTSPAAHGDHADLEGDWVFHCAHPEALRQLDLGFFAQSQHAQKIEVMLITAKKQSKLRLMRPQASIKLTPL
jgi:Protein of unknown function (DUF2796)